MNRRSSDVPDEVLRAFETLLRRAPGRRERRAIADKLGDRSTVGSTLIALATSREYQQDLGQRLAASAPAGDEEFLEHVYLELVHREPDESGKTFFLEALRGGEPRASVAEKIAASDEHVSRVVRELYPLPNIRAAEPGRYQDVVTLDGLDSVACFVADTDEDFAWIEQAIHTFDYYDRPGIWGSAVDDDKRRVAEMIAGLAPTTVLDVGCANGAVIKCLVDLGIDAHGVELSESAVERALPEIRDRIHVGDIGALSLETRFDLISGLDIFEHVPPAKVRPIIDSLMTYLEPGGLIFANIPAFGHDEVFGTVFDIYLAAWSDSAASRRPFGHLHVDDMGFPLHGHITWATSDWWERQFLDAGLDRRTDLEGAAHAKYDDALRRDAPSRLAFYVFQSPGN